MPREATPSTPGGVERGSSPAGCVEVYVYFRSEPSTAAEVRAALARHRALLDQAGCAGMRTGLRVESSPKDYLTWLEVHRFDDIDGDARGAAAAPLEARLEAIERCARDSGLATLALHGRHREVFGLPG